MIAPTLWQTNQHDKEELSRSRHPPEWARLMAQVAKHVQLCSDGTLELPGVGESLDQEQQRLRQSQKDQKTVWISEEVDAEMCVTQHGRFARVLESVSFFLLAMKTSCPTVTRGSQDAKIRNGFRGGLGFQGVLGDPRGPLSSNRFPGQRSILVLSLVLGATRRAF